MKIVEKIFHLMEAWVGTALLVFSAMFVFEIIERRYGRHASNLAGVGALGICAGMWFQKWLQKISIKEDA